MEGDVFKVKSKLLEGNVFVDQMFYADSSMNSISEFKIS